jgi:putative hydrolase of the HAD superfamily
VSSPDSAGAVTSTTSSYLPTWVWRKPAPAIFTHAAAALGCAPGEILHVGDSIEHDIAGALAAGLHAAWLDHNRPVNLDPRVLRLQSLTELPALVDN